VKKRQITWLLAALATLGTANGTPLGSRVQGSAEVCAIVLLSEANCEQRSEDERPKLAHEFQRPTGPSQYALLESTCVFWPTNYQRPPPFSSLA
jgi:hypothetical protein